MSQEFWFGAVFSGALFILGTLVSIFSSDIRNYFREWRKNRQLRGKSLKLAKLSRELSEHERYAADPAAASAFFWSGLFLIICVLMLIALATFLILQLQSLWLMPYIKALLGVLWFMVYTVAYALHNKASNLRHSKAHVEQLKERIEKLKIAKGSGMA